MNRSMLLIACVLMDFPILLMEIGRMPLPLAALTSVVDVVSTPLLPWSVLHRFFFLKARIVRVFVEVHLFGDLHSVKQLVSAATCGEAY